MPSKSIGKYILILCNQPGVTFGELRWLLLSEVYGTVTVEYGTAFLRSYWVYFLRLGIKRRSSKKTAFKFQVSSFSLFAFLVNILIITSGNVWRGDL